MRKAGKRVIFKSRDIEKSLKRIVEEIVKKNGSMEDVVLVGIRTGGAFLAKRLQGLISRLGLPEPPTGVLDITLYRDDWTRIGSAPTVGKTELPFSIDNKTIILIDDVLFTGRTIRAAMDALIDFGRPKKIELAILVDRGDNDRELPIQANYVGGVWNISPNETINVYLQEGGYEDHVTIEEKRAVWEYNNPKREEGREVDQRTGAAGIGKEARNDRIT
jgi:pyrimidine operon attenuation protein/uracil phosphoribosyltransferase